MPEKTIASQFLAADLERAAKSHFKTLFPERVLSAVKSDDGLTVTVTKACNLTGFITRETHPAETAPIKAALSITEDQKAKILDGMKVFFDGAVHAAATALKDYFPDDQIVTMLADLGVSLADEELVPAHSPAAAPAPPAPPEGPSQTPAA